MESLVCFPFQLCCSLYAGVLYHRMSHQKIMACILCMCFPRLLPGLCQLAASVEAGQCELWEIVY